MDVAELREILKNPFIDQDSRIKNADGLFLSHVIIEDKEITFEYSRKAVQG